MSAKNKSKILNNKFISIRGARVNNLKNIDIDIPHNKMVVFTGLSGSGKTSLLFDTIYTEGQRRYVESLSSYARQFLERVNKPDVDSITGLAPSMAIERKKSSRNPRSTVGTSTEIYDYLRLLFARVGTTFSPVSGKEVKRNSVESILKFMHRFDGKIKIYISFPMHYHTSKTILDDLENLKQKGFFRIIIDSRIIDLNTSELSGIRLKNVKVIADRLIFEKDNSDIKQRLSDSLELAFNEGDGYLSIFVKDDSTNSIENEVQVSENSINLIGYKEYLFNKHLECDGIRFEEPEPQLFSFNNPIGACPRCQGFGETVDIDPDLIIPDINKSIFQGAIHPFSTPKHSRHLNDLISVSKKFNIRIHQPVKDLSPEEMKLIYNGAGDYLGINKFFKMVEKEALYKIHYRVLMSRYKAYTKCNECNGSRLKKEALFVKFRNKTISDFVGMSIEDLYNFFVDVRLNPMEKQIAGRILEELKNRLSYLFEVGLGYLTLNRLSSTLSGGETQRINLATTLGSNLVGSIYVLDEPSIGLHPVDNEKLINILKSLRDIGNTVLIVEHDPDIIKSSDYVVDIGPDAGDLGGEIIYSGDLTGLRKSINGYTGKYLSGKLKIELPKQRRILNGHFLHIIGASENNLKNIDVSIPLESFVCVTGVSGSGKSTLISDILYGALKKKLEGIYNEKIGKHSDLLGYKFINSVELVDQTPIGKSPRSNPVTYLKIFELIRELFGNLPSSRLKGFSPGSFSFNIPGGRCETCEGLGVIRIAMQFMADIYLECDVCKGKRYKKDLLDIYYSNKNISNVLDLTVSLAIRFFAGFPKIISKLKILESVGLGYLKLGQSATTLSGGEAQRIKLAYHLSFQESGNKTLFIFDEPTTGLHLHDISKLLKSFNELLNKGNSIIVIEHNLEVIKCADYIIDLGPESGNKGGNVVAQCSPEELLKVKNSFTGRYLKNVLKK